ncbi:hypothetical protein ATO6_23650 [Oceanicola sp. 22II-s10i]|nr:hypothetical protein ATO6_23650 [Oceanicola sp. 22II-s10i]
MARNALEEGHFARANTSYARLLPQAGPLGGRIRLEYAHSLLRAGDFDAAAKQASTVAAAESGPVRGAARAVEGTAHHEIGLALLAKGDRAGGKARLTAAQAALAEALSDNPEGDPLGSLAGRKASIDARLKRL